MLSDLIELHEFAFKIEKWLAASKADAAVVSLINPAALKPTR